MKPVANLAEIVKIETSGAFDTLPESTYDLICRSAEVWPDKTAISFFLSADRFADAERWTYGQLIARVRQMANAFHALGVGKDDVIAVVLPNLPEGHFALWGGEAAGIVAVFNPLLEPPTLASLIASVKAKVLVTLAPIPQFDLFARLLPELKGAATLEHVVLVNMADHLPGPDQSAFREQISASASRLLNGSGARMQPHDFAGLLVAQETGRLVSGRRISASDRSSMFCTGGTTGLPKIAVRRHGNEVANAYAVGQFLGDALSASSTFFCGLPLFHVNGVIVTGLVPFVRGSHVVIGTPQGYRGEGLIARFWEIVEHYKINFFSAVPTLYSALMQVPVRQRDISSLTYGFCGAAPMPVEVFRAFERTTRLQILEGYGLTEACCVSSINPPAGEKRVGSIGLRLPGQEMKAVVLDDKGAYQRDGAVDEVGLLVVSGPNVFEGYFSKAHNQGLWIDLSDGKRWLNTGDLGRQDKDGYFWLTGRKKELIIRGGHNIDPATIEESLHQHPDVELVAAIGRPDAYAGELPIAYVQLKPGAVVTPDVLAEFARSQIGERAAVPKFVRIVPQIPVTPVGKIFKPALKRLEIVDAISSALREARLDDCEVSVAEVPERGVIVSVGVPKGGDDAAVRQVLGTFSYPFTIEKAS